MQLSQCSRKKSTACYKKWTHVSRIAHPYNKRDRPLCYAAPLIIQSRFSALKRQFSLSRIRSGVCTPIVKREEGSVTLPRPWLLRSRSLRDSSSVVQVLEFHCLLWQKPLMELSPQVMAHSDRMICIAFRCIRIFCPFLHLFLNACPRFPHSTWSL